MTSQLIALLAAWEAAVDAPKQRKRERIDREQEADARLAVRSTRGAQRH